MLKEKTIEAYALKNSLEHNGKAIEGAVINSLFNEGLKKQEIKEIQKILSLHENFPKFP